MSTKHNLYVIIEYYIWLSIRRTIISYIPKELISCLLIKLLIENIKAIPPVRVIASMELFAPCFAHLPTIIIRRVGQGTAN